MDVEWTLQRAVHRDAAILGHGDHAVRLDVQLLLVSRSVFAFNDDVGAVESRADVALHDAEILEDLCGLKRVEEGLESITIDLDPCLAKPVEVLVCQQE